MGFNVFMRLVVMALLWGPSFLFIKVAVQDIPPLTIAAARVSLAAVMLYVALRFQGHALPKFGSIWKHFAVTGFASNALPFAVLGWGEQYIDSAVAAMLIGTTPLFTIVLAHLFTVDDRLTPTKAVGALLGFGGMSLLLAPALIAGVQATVWGLIAATVAAASYAVGIYYSRQHLRGLPSLVGPTAQLTMAAIYLLPLSVIIDQPYTLPTPSLAALGSLALLTLLCTFFAFIVYFRTMEMTGASNLSMVTYLIPMVGAILGVVVLHEQLGWKAYLGFGLTILGVMIVNGVFKLSGRPRLTSAAVRP